MNVEAAFSMQTCRPLIRRITCSVLKPPESAAHIELPPPPYPACDKPSRASLRFVP